MLSYARPVWPAYGPWHCGSHDRTAQDTVLFHRELGDGLKNLSRGALRGGPLKPLTELSSCSGPSERPAVVFGPATKHWAGQMRLRLHPRKTGRDFWQLGGAFVARIGFSSEDSDRTAEELAALKRVGT